MTYFYRYMYKVFIILKNTVGLHVKLNLLTLQFELANIAQSCMYHYIWALYTTILHQDTYNV